MRKEKMRVRIDFSNTRLFDEKIEPEQLELFTKKVRKKFN